MKMANILPCLKKKGSDATSYIEKDKMLGINVDRHIGSEKEKKKSESRSWTSFATAIFSEQLPQIDTHVRCSEGLGI